MQNPCFFTCHWDDDDQVDVLKLSWALRSFSLTCDHNDHPSGSAVITRCVRGQSLRDDGAEAFESDPYEEFINGLPAPDSFPSTEFTISRFPNSGEVVGIHVTGGYVALEAEVEALKPEYEFRDSELFDGVLNDIAGVLASEYERRNAR